MKWLRSDDVQLCTGGLVVGEGGVGGGVRVGGSLVLRGAVSAVSRFGGLRASIAEGLVSGSHTGG